MLGLRRTAVPGVLLCGLLGVGCLEDLLLDSSYEPNDSFEEAADISGLSPISAEITDSDPEDYFYVELPAGSLLTVTCVHWGAPGEITVSLYDASRNGLADSTSVAAGEVVTYGSVTEGGYYIVVYYSGSDISVYDLDWILTL